MIILNISVIILLFVCLLTAEKNQLQYIPQWISILIVLNKENIINRLDNEYKFEKLNDPYFNSECTTVTLQFRFLPKVNRQTTLSNFSVDINGFIDRMECPVGNLIDNIADYRLDLDKPTDMLIKIKAYQDSKLYRLISIKYLSNSRKNTKWFYIKKPRI